MKVLTEVPDRREDASKVLNASSLHEVDMLQGSERRRTNEVWLYIFVVFIILSIPLLIYTLYYTDINRVKGYDDCGNVCGQKNIKYEQWNCTGQDMTLKPFFVIHSFRRECMDNREISDLTGYILKREKIFDYIHRAMYKVALGFFIPLALCLILIVMFHYTPNVAVWSILLVSWLIFTLVGVLLYYPAMRRTGPLPFAIICIASILSILWILFNSNNIQLVSGLLQKATRPLFEIKKIICVSLGAMTVSLLILLIHSTMHFHMTTAGKLHDIVGFLYYIPDDIMRTATILNVMVAIWVILIVLGVQNMTTSGAVAEWYTTKNQDNLSDVVHSSFSFTIKNHLGTIALGSVLRTIMFIPRLFLQFLAAFSSMKEKADAALRYLDGFFTNNSYILTAMYGTSFVQSGKQASKLLNVSIGNIRELNNFGNFVMTVAHCFVIFISTVAISFAFRENSHAFNPFLAFFILIVCGIASLCTFTILETLKISLNTVFFCETEELWRNKEADEPFTITMKELVDGSNKLFLQRVQSKPPWYIREKRFYIKLFLFIFVCISLTLLIISFFI